MDFDQAVTSHVSWKAKLKKYLAKPDRSLVPAGIAQDNQCELGKWIIGEGNKYASLPEFQALRSEHTRFHKTAAEVVRHADSGQNVDDDVALGSHSEFASASSGVVGALMALKSKVAKSVAVHK